MLRSSSMVAAVLVLLGATELMAQPMDVTVSGQNVIAILDTDMDGMPDPPNDCNFTAQVTGSNLMVDGNLGTGTQLQGCTGDYMGTVSPNSGFEINFTSAPGVVGFVQLPTLVDLFQGSGGGGSGVPSNGPLVIDKIEIDFEEGSENAGGCLCNSGGPAAQVRTTDGMTVLMPLEYFPDSDNPQFLKAPGIPISNAIGNKVFIDGYIPVTSERKIVVQVEGSDDPIVEIDLDNLSPCGTQAVPTATEWGLIVLMLGLLAFGVWVLRQRPRFANAMAML